MLRFRSSWQLADQAWQLLDARSKVVVQRLKGDGRLALNTQSANCGFEAAFGELFESLLRLPRFDDTESIFCRMRHVLVDRGLLACFLLHMFPDRGGFF